MNEKGKAIEEFIVNDLQAGSSVESVGADEDLLASDLIDSLGIRELVAFIESQFGVAVEEDDLTPDNFRTIGTIVTFVEQRQR